MREVDQGTLAGLAAKLDELDLDDGEQALLDRLLDRATSYQPEVAGFGMFSYSGDLSGADLSATGFRLGQGLGLLSSNLGLGDKGIMFETFERPPPP